MQKYKSQCIFLYLKWNFLLAWVLIGNCRKTLNKLKQTWNCCSIENFSSKETSMIYTGLNKEAHCHLMVAFVHLQMNFQSTFDLVWIWSWMNRLCRQNRGIQDSTCNLKRFHEISSWHTQTFFLFFKVLSMPQNGHKPVKNFEAFCQMNSDSRFSKNGQHFEIKSSELCVFFWKCKISFGLRNAKNCKFRFLNCSRMLNSGSANTWPQLHCKNRIFKSRKKATEIHQAN